MNTHCDAGCQKPFDIEQFDTDKLHDDIERVGFTCPHCNHRYVAFYTNAEIRKLQARIRRVQQRFADPNDNHEDAANKESALQKQIKESMDALRHRIESA